MTSCPVEQKDHRETVDNRNVPHMRKSQLQHDIISFFRTSVLWVFMEAESVQTQNRSKGGKTLHDTVFWQTETTGLKPGVTSLCTDATSIQWFLYLTQICRCIFAEVK